MAYVGCVAPPPGLEAMAPARSGVLPPPGLEGMAPRTLQHPGIWVGTVLAAAPHLSPEGLRRALAIIDRATRNAEHVKAMDDLIGAADPAERAAAPYLQSAALLRSQVSGEQVQLLEELQKLRLDYGGLAGQAGTPPAAPATAPPSAAMPPAAPATAPPSAAAAAVVAPRRAVAACASPTAEPAPALAEGPPRKGSKDPKSPKNPGEKPCSRPVQTLSTSLQLLSNENPDCLLIVRHINKLGFQASRTLKRHYSAFGTVVRVLVAHSTVRQSGSLNSHARRRPSSLGFMHMASPQAAKAILAAGPEQEVDGCMISVQKFQRQQMPAANECEEDKELADLAFQRSETACSDGSLASVSTGISEGSSGCESCE